MFKLDIDPKILGIITEKIISLCPPDEQISKLMEISRIGSLDPSRFIYWKRLRKILTELDEVAKEKGLYADTLMWQEVFLFHQVFLYVEDREKKLEDSINSSVFKNCDRLN